MNRRPDKLEKGSPYPRVEYLENVGWSRVFLPVYPKAGDVVEIESELSYTDVSFRQSELAGYDAPCFFWGVYDTPTWYAGGTDTLYSQQTADTDWHMFKLVSLGEDAGLWVDGQKIIDIKQYPDVVYAPQGIELWSYSNGRRNSLNKKKWLRITINGREVMHLLPVLDDRGEPALYDLVSRQLFYNCGEDELVAGPEIVSKNYIPLEYVEVTDNHNGAPSAYLQLPVNANLLVDKLAFETEHELHDCGENQAEGRNTYSPRIFYGVRTSGRNYYGISYDSNSSVAEGSLPVASGFVVHKVEYDSGVLRCYQNGQLDATITKGVPSKDMYFNNMGVFVAIGIPLVTSNSGSAFPFNGRKKYFKVWVNDKMVYHLIPVLDMKGRPCMYDVVNFLFCYSDGESDFIAGPVLVT